MNINNKPYRTIWEKKGNNRIIQIIDQRVLPHKFIIKDLLTVKDFYVAIKDMYVRGAPLIGVTAAYGMYIACIEAKNDNTLIFKSAEYLKSARPTAVNLQWAVESQLEIINNCKDLSIAKDKLLKNARRIAEEDIANCKKIGEYGCELIEAISKKKNGQTVNILTHCNAGWLATVDYGTATAPIYEAFSRGIKLHVWVDETRPRNQGAKLTSWELNQEGIPNTIIVDNAGGHLMQNKQVDLVIVGSDRTTYLGDVANKIGTYLKALAAKDNNIPFYVALPSSTIDWNIKDSADIPIEERNGNEVKYIDGLLDDEIKNVLISPIDSKVANYAFDVTPSRLVTGLITERGIIKANKNDIFRLFTDKKK